VSANKIKKVKADQMHSGAEDDRMPAEVIFEEFSRSGFVEYELLDSGEGRKLEQLGEWIIERQAPVAFWNKRSSDMWKEAHAVHQRSDKGGGFWKGSDELPDFFFTKLGRVIFKTKLTSFGHLGFFAEQKDQWDWFYNSLSPHQDESLKVLNLFAYTGATSIACAQAGAKVTHVDAARGVVDWAKQNAAINKIPEGAIRYAVEDVSVFLEREAKRGNQYDAIIMDPPSFGRGPKKELFKIEEDIRDLLKKVKAVMSPDLKIFHFSSHSPGFSPEVLKNLSAEILDLDKFQFESGEMLIEENESSRYLPSGVFVRFKRK
jgi:23S rRNA (cytosine1962-C5)-methyltransferase